MNRTDEIVKAAEALWNEVRNGCDVTRDEIDAIVKACELPLTDESARQSAIDRLFECADACMDIPCGNQEELLEALCDALNDYQKYVTPENEVEIATPTAAEELWPTPQWTREVPKDAGYYFWRLPMMDDEDNPPGEYKVDIVELDEAQMMRRVRDIDSGLPWEKPYKWEGAEWWPVPIEIPER